MHDFNDPQISSKVRHGGPPSWRLRLVGSLVALATLVPSVAQARPGGVGGQISPFRITRAVFDFLKGLF